MELLMINLAEYLTPEKSDLVRQCFALVQEEESAGKVDQLMARICAATDGEWLHTMVAVFAAMFCATMSQFIRQSKEENQ